MFLFPYKLTMDFITFSRHAERLFWNVSKSRGTSHIISLLISPGALKLAIINRYIITCYKNITYISSNFIYFEHDFINYSNQNISLAFTSNHICKYFVTVNG